MPITADHLHRGFRRPEPVRGEPNQSAQTTHEADFVIPSALIRSYASALHIAPVLIANLDARLKRDVWARFSLVSARSAIVIRFPLREINLAFSRPSLSIFLDTVFRRTNLVDRIQALRGATGAG